jgi:hypothetical protein
MLLAHAIQRNAVSLGQAQNTYKQNVIAVNTLVTSVLTSKLPQLNQNPPDWPEFVAAYEQADATALGWVNNVMGHLLEVPTDVQNYNSMITNLLQDAKTQATTLITQPTNQAALQALNQDLTGLTSQLALVTGFISGAITAVQNFKDQLPTMAQNLQTIAQKSATDANADKAKIAQLNTTIANLQAEIKSLTAAIIALAIVDGIALTIGVAATIAAWPFGALVWLMLGPAVIAATTVIALDGIKITQDKAAIEVAQGQLTGLSADVSTLSVLANNYAGMVTEAEQIETSLQAILAAWQALATDVGTAVTDIRTAISDTSANNFQAVVNDVQGAITEWTAAYQAAGALHLDLLVNNAPIQYGMSSSQVQATLATVQPVNIMTYYNSVQQSRQASAEVKRAATAGY